MSELAYTLIADGPSDRALTYILDWLLLQHSRQPLKPQFADLEKLPLPVSNLAKRVETALDLWPCDLLFVHRDAERESREVRLTEIRRKLSPCQFTWVPVIPVRMQEAWLLFDEPALRFAAGNPNGNEALELPSLGKVEGLPNPKAVLEGLLRTASGLRGRRLARFSTNYAKRRLAGLIKDFSALRRLPAFAALEDDIRKEVERLGWGFAKGQ
jgi:hypothetical protein